MFFSRYFLLLAFERSTLPFSIPSLCWGFYHKGYFFSINTFRAEYYKFEKSTFGKWRNNAI